MYTEQQSLCLFISQEEVLLTPIFLTSCCCCCCCCCCNNESVCKIDANERDELRRGVGCILYIQTKRSEKLINQVDFFVICK